MIAIYGFNQLSKLSVRWLILTHNQHLPSAMKNRNILTKIYLRKMLQKKFQRVRTRLKQNLGRGYHPRFVSTNLNFQYHIHSSCFSYINQHFEIF